MQTYEQNNETMKFEIFQFSGKLPGHKKWKKDDSSKDSRSTSSTISTAVLESYVEKLRTKCNRSTTRKIYYCMWKRFNEFFIQLDVKPGTWEDRLILFVSYLVEQNKKSSTIRSYISAVKSVLREDNVEINENRYLLNALTKSCKYKNERVRIRLPIQKGILKIILGKISEIYSDNGQVYLEKLYKAMFAAGYYGLLRVGEITSGAHPIKAADVHITMNKRKILFILRTLKTHWPDTKPQRVKITSTNNYESTESCPYRILREFFSI